LVTSVGAWILCSWRPGFPRRLSLALAPLKYSGQVYLNFSLKYFRQHIDKVILGKYGGSEALGHYDRAYQLSQLPATQVLTPLHSVAQATLSRLIDDKERFIAFFTRAVRMVALLGVYASLILMLTGEDVIFLLLGPDWNYAGKIVKAFSPGIAGMLVNGTDSWLHLSLGTPDRWLKWNIFYAVLTVVSFVAVAPYGPIAMAIAFSVVSNLLVLPSLWYAGRPFKIDVKTLLSSFGTYYVSAGVVAAVWLSASTLWAPLRMALTHFGPVGRIVIVSGAASLLYILIIIAIDRGFRSLNGVISFAKIFFKRRS
jgi:O-antigen/teichoic acid export membrane protein